ncbi:NHLM bacteriocin system ABC transporter, ATP-binding protein [Microbacterium sp. cf046]|uniref:NHLP bacteriocin export ABC transporter permease/ATPase subunit n=1 Tax=Microbacterium sp. cf046 TaxID=1761803 RepID=UPI0008E8E62A|nr:NHLP bacteriocin export ABC transporter permease/ATPase subunit [Microbacterium sp. cf046]SFS07422.1 NHLM bacteriocin system ABC transporter, ATP-binding protein [Microbacterium sp. cf046]
MSDHRDAAAGASAADAELELGANRPLLLSGADRSWLVVRGVIEVFSVAGDAGEPDAPRLHIATATSGEVLFGIDESRAGSPRLVAVGGADSAVRIVAVLSPDDRRVRSRWVRELAAAVSAESDPAHTTDLLDSAEDADEADEALGRAIAARREQVRADDAARVLAQRMQHEGAMSDGLETLGDLVGTGDARILRRSVGDPLFAAFRLVAKAQGVAQPSAGVGSPGEDPLLRMAEASGTRIRRVLLNSEWWQQDSGPMLGYVADGHRPVALIPVRSGRYQVVDPVAGTRTLIDGPGADALELEAFAVYRPLPDGPLTVGGLVRSSLVEAKGDIARLLAFALGAALLALAVPIVTGQIVGSVIPEANLPELLQLTLALLVATLAGALLQLTTVIAVLRIQGRVDRYLIPALWGRLLSLPTTFFRRYTAGDLAFRVQSAGAIVKLVSGTSVSSLLGGVFSLVSLGLIWYYSIEFGVISTVLLALLVATMFFTARVQLRRMQAVERASGKLTGMLLEFISGLSKLRVAGAQEKAFRLWAMQFSFKRERWNSVRSAENFGAVIGAVFPIVSSIVLFAAVGLSQQPPVSPGVFLAISAAYGQVVVALLGMSNSTTQFIRTLPGLQRILPVLVEQPEEDAAKADPGVLRGAVEFSGITFRYQADGPVVLDDVSISIPAGSSVALVGPSGSGKSTLGRMLLGFEEPEEGGVFFDNQDLAGLDVRAVRRQLGVVLQSVQLLPGTILSNIIGEAVDLTIDDAWRAAADAGLAADIEAMPMGMHTAISEGGSTLSGGQRQRLLIARALAGDPRILLFDEATSALDNTTQAIVADSLAALSATRIVIAHRLSTVIGADCIYYLERGQIVESGTFDELMALDGRFAAQARRQLT